MTKYFLITFALFFFFNMQATTIYVDSTQIANAPTGESWQFAFFDLQDALAIAEYGDEIWVAQGTYLPTSDPTDRTATFLLPNGVKLYGGFNGLETALEERNWQFYETILSGKIAEGGNITKSFHVVSVFDADSTTWIDGVTIKDGEAYGIFEEQDKYHGAAIYHLQTTPQATSFLNVKNCLFEHNVTYKDVITDDGGGIIYNETNNGFIRTRLANCFIEKNEGHFQLLYNRTTAPNDSIYVEIDSCLIQYSLDNRSFLKSNARHAKITVTFKNSIIQHFSPLSPEEWVILKGDTSSLELNFENCLLDSIYRADNFSVSFINNEGVDNQFNISFSNTTISNFRRVFGVQILDTLSNLKLNISSSHFSNLHHPSFLRLSYLDTLEVNINNNIITDTIYNLCTINKIKSKESIAILNNTIVDSYMDVCFDLSTNATESNILIDSCLFTGNTFHHFEGPIEISPHTNTNIIAQNCIFQDNALSTTSIAGYTTGFLIVPNDILNQQGGNITIKNCHFENNISTNFNNASCISAAPPYNFYDNLVINTNLSINNCTFVNNQGGNRGAIYTRNYNTAINNCLFTGNSTLSGQGVVDVERKYELEQSLTTLTNCTFANNTGSAIFNNSSQLTLQNCIIDGEALVTSDEFFTPSNTLYNNLFTQSDCPPDFTICTDNLWATDPLFLAPDSANYRLQACSPASNAGNNAFVNSEEDLQGETRIKDAQVDMGAYETPEMSIEITEQSPDFCGGAADGSTTLTASDFCPPLSVEWENGMTNELIFSGLAAGGYPLTITDARGRTALFNLTIDDTLTLQIDTTLLQADCATGTPGSIFAEVSGGILPYNLLWNTGETTAQLDDILIGMYQLTVTDSVGCVDSIWVQMQPTGEIPVEFEVTPITCHDANDGMITMFTSGGFEPLDYHWLGGMTEATIENAWAGSYEGYIADTAGCFGVGNMLLENPTAINATATIMHSDTPTSNNGSIEVTNISGGAAPYEIEWSTGAVNETISDLAAGIYVLTITDSAGCAQTFDYTIDIINSVAEIEANTVTLFPNPVAANAFIYCQNENNLLTHYQWRSSNGKLLQSAAIPSNGTIATPAIGGLYLLEILGNNGVRKVVKITVF